MATTALTHARAAATLAPRLTVGEEVVKFVRTKPLGAAGGAIILGVVLGAIFPGVLATYDPYLGGYAVEFSRACRVHWFGTREFGRAALSRVMYGTRIALC